MHGLKLPSPGIVFQPGKKLKTIVINERENERVPFLRGILTRSLLDAGLAFEDAFDNGYHGSRSTGRHS